MPEKDEHGKPAGTLPDFESVFNRLNDAAARFEKHIEPEEFRTWKAKSEKLEAALEVAKAGLQSIEQLPSPVPHESGARAREVLSAIAQALK